MLCLSMPRNSSKIIEWLLQRNGNEMAFDPSKILDKLQRGFAKINGAARETKIVKFTITRQSDFDQANTLEDPLTITPPPIVLDQQLVFSNPNVGDFTLAQSFGAALEQDEKIFLIISDCLVERTPIETLALRSEQFLRERSLENGCIEYGEDRYTIVSFKPQSTALGIVPIWAVKVKAHTPTPS